MENTLELFNQKVKEASLEELSQSWGKMLKEKTELEQSFSLLNNEYEYIFWSKIEKAPYYEKRFSELKTLLNEIQPKIDKLNSELDSNSSIILSFISSFKDEAVQAFQTDFLNYSLDKEKFIEQFNEVYENPVLNRLLASILDESLKGFSDKFLADFCKNIKINTHDHLNELFGSTNTVFDRLRNFYQTVNK